MSAKKVWQKFAEQAGIHIDGDRPWDIHVHNERFYDRLLKNGTIGLGESYMEGWWDCDAIDVMVCKALRAKVDTELTRNFSFLSQFLLSRLVNLQSPSRADIVAKQHYDIDPSIFKAMLDPWMQYSCGYWQAGPVPDGFGEESLYGSQGQAQGQQRENAAAESSSVTFAEPSAEPSTKPMSESTAGFPAKPSAKPSAEASTVTITDVSTVTIAEPSMENFTELSRKISMETSGITSGDAIADASANASANASAAVSANVSANVSAHVSAAVSEDTLAETSGDVFMGTLAETSAESAESFAEPSAESAESLEASSVEGTSVGKVSNKNTSAAFRVESGNFAAQGERNWETGHSQQGKQEYTIVHKKLGIPNGLDAAQIAKMEMICRKLKLEPHMNVLDIGCGFGGLARYMAQFYGVKVRGITLSKEQLEIARSSSAGLSVDYRLMDYRDISGHYDRIVSVGMFEHVGRKNYAEFFRIARNALTHDGLFLLHSIGTDSNSAGFDPWLTRYIFPNGILPSISAMAGVIQKNFVMEDWHNFGADYDRTLLAWHANFQRGYKEKSFVCDEVTQRMFTYYLLSCAGAFRARAIQLWQVVMSPDGIMGGYCCRD